MLSGLFLLQLSKGRGFLMQFLNFKQIKRILNILMSKLEEFWQVSLNLFFYIAVNSFMSDLPLYYFTEVSVQI